MARGLDLPEGLDSQCMTVCSRVGSVVEMVLLSDKGRYVLATVQNTKQFAVCR